MEDTCSFENMLIIETSRRNADAIAEIIFQKHELFEDLYKVFAGNRDPVSRRAAWVLDIVSEQHPDLIASHLEEMITLLPSFNHDGLKRHSMKILARSPLPPETHLGELIKISFNWLLSACESVAVKIYCMEILYRISEAEPDLKKELADSIEWRLNEESAGFYNRGKKVLKKLYQEMDNNHNTL